MSIGKEIKQSSFQSPFHKVILNLMFTGNDINRKMNQMFKTLDLSVQQYNVLRILKGNHPKPYHLNDIQARMLDKNSNSTRLVEKLRLKGLLTRVQCPESRRQVNIGITEEGLKVLEDVSTHVEAFMNRFESFGNDKAEVLSELIDEFRKQDCS